MTFNEAIDAKKKIKPEYNKLWGNNWKMFVVPENDLDFTEYIKSASNLFMDGQLTDEHALLFTTHNSFKLRILYHVNNAVLHGSVNINT